MTRDKVQTMLQSAQQHAEQRAKETVIQERMLEQAKAAQNQAHGEVIALSKLLQSFPSEE